MLVDFFFYALFVSWGGSQDSLQAGDQCEEGVCIEKSPEGVGERSSSGHTPFQQPAGGLSSGPGHPNTKKFEAVLLYRLGGMSPEVLAGLCTTLTL